MEGGIRFRATVGIVWLALVLAGRPGALGAQEWTWPARAENLTELPADFPPERLSAVMRGFTQALGVRCSHCHVGEEGRPLSTYDFVSDANPNKERARAMYRMLGVVNDHLSEIEPSGDPVNMWCHTCHNGKARPQTLGEAIGERNAVSGATSAFELFLALRERYYGAAAYDFTAPAIDRVASEFSEAGDTAIAHRLVSHNAQTYPSHGPAQARLGEVWLARGDTVRAIEQLERALEIQPGNRRIEALLERLRGH